MIVNLKENTGIIGLFVGLVFLSVWLQFGLLQPEQSAEEAALDNQDPDFYIYNFVSTGIGDDGKKYQVIADRMVHYPLGDRALLDNPHIIRYDLSDNPDHVYADSGWLYDNQSTILLTGNVRTVQIQETGSEAASNSEKMVIRLKNKRGWK